MTLEIVLLLGIVAFAVTAFAFEWMPIDVVALTCLGALLVFGPGGYRFLDYVRFGGPLVVIFWLLSTLLIPVIWPF